jgi:hypothetical protein
MKLPALCLVDTEDQAATIVEKLRSAVFSDNDISVLFPDKGRLVNSLTKKKQRCPKVQPSAPARAVPLAAQLDC